MSAGSRHIGALAGPLLHLAGRGAAAFIHHERRRRSTTAASVWGRGGSPGYVKAWRATANGLEGAAASATDTVLNRSATMPRLPPLLVAHSCEEKSLSEVVRHELRWARTIFTVDPVGYIGSGFAHALPLSLMGAALRGFDALGLAAVLSALASRVFLKYRLTRQFDSQIQLCSPMLLETFSRSQFILGVFGQRASAGADRISRLRGTERCWRRLSRKSAPHLMERR